MRHRVFMYDTIYVPPVGGDFNIPTTLTISGDTARLTFESPNYQHNSYIIERRMNGGSWQTIEVAYQFTNPMSGVYSLTQNWQKVFPYIYYYDSGLNSGQTYEYRISGGGGVGTTDAVTVVGTTYYVKTGGSDAAAGTSDGTAWATISKVQSTMQPGDLILFNKGDTWSSGSRVTINTDGGTADNPTKWGVYGSGNKPVFYFTADNGLDIRDVSNWVIEGVKITGSTAANIYVYALNASVDNIKIFDCYLDGTNHATASFAACIFLQERDSGAGAYDLTNVEIAYCSLYNAGNGVDKQDGIKAFAVTAGYWGHNNWGDNNGDGFMDIGGGNYHVAEWNVARSSNDNPTYGDFSKTHGQQHSNRFCRFNRNLGWNGRSFGIGIQDSYCGSALYNTIYKPLGYAASFEDATNEVTNHHGNVRYKNIWAYTLSGGAWRSDVYTNSGVTTWYKRNISKYNCIYHGSSYIVWIRDIFGLTTDGEFNTTWKGTYGYDTDIHENPGFNNIGGEDFTVTNSNVDDFGFFAPIEASIQVAGAYVTDTEKNVIYVLVDKPLDPTYNSTSGITASGKTVTAVSVVYDYWLKITVNSAYTSSDTITVSINIPLKDRYNNLTFPVLTNQEIDKNGII